MLSVDCVYKMSKLLFFLFSFTLQTSAKVVGEYSICVAVFLSIQRHHFKQVKVAVPVILNVMKTISLESDYADTELEDLFDRALGIANSIHAVCAKLVCDFLHDVIVASLGYYEDSFDFLLSDFDYIVTCATGGQRK